MNRTLDRIVPRSVLDGVRAQPLLLVRGQERQGLERWESAGLGAALHEVPEGMRAPGEVPVGALAPLDGPYDTVVTGICLGSSTEDKQRWVRGGPTVETVCGVDHAARIAAATGAALTIWVVDQEYLNVAQDRMPSDDGEPLDLIVGAAVEQYLFARYPAAQVLRTSNPHVRAELYARLSREDLARRYPRGVRAPNGVSGPTLWFELQFLSCVATMLLQPGRTLVVVDTDQLRAAHAANHLDPRVNALLYLPVPQLGWTVSRDPHPGRWTSAAAAAPRRMHRAISANRLHIDEAMPLPGQWVPEAAREVAWYLTGETSHLDSAALPDLDACLQRRRDHRPPA